MADIPTGTVTFLFTDIEGSTRLLQERADYAALQEEHNRILERAIDESGGVKIRTEGDSFFAVFESAPAAVNAAATIQRRLAEHGWPEGGTIRVRAGMHTGEGVRGGDDYLGIDVNRAARIAAAAHGGQVLISDATRALAERALPDGVALRDVGAHRLKDLVRPERLSQLEIDGLTNEFPPPRSLDARPHNLPVQLTSFVGRRDAIREVVGRVRSHRLVTLTGPGGTGKTRLALQVAAEALADFRDGVSFVDLSPVTDPDLVVSNIATVLHVPDRSDRDPLAALIESVGDQEILLILDNFEQVLAAASVVDALLRAAPRVRILVTSRAVLRIYGENEYAVEPLTLPDGPADPRALARYEAISLFVDRAASAQPGFCLDEGNAAAVAEICARLDGLPLAIELAASRIKLMSPPELLAHLDRRLPLLTGGARNLPERQRTLRGAIEWSVGLLEEPERRLLARLSVFAGGATLEAIDQVANPAGELGVDTMDSVASLVDQSLVRRRASDTGSRFVLLETIREYASEQLAGEGDAASIRQRHARYVADLCELGEPHFTAADQRAWLDRFDVEQDNIRAALRRSIDTSDPETGLRILAAAWRFWQQRGHITEGRRWARELRTLAADHVPASVRARAAAAAGNLAYWQADGDETMPLYREQLEFARASGDAGLVLDAEFNAALLKTFTDKFDEGVAEVLAVLESARRLGDRERLCGILDAAAYTAYVKGDYETSLRYNEEAAALAREIGNHFVLSETVETTGQIYRALGNYSRSREAYLESLRLKRDDGNLIGIVMTLKMLAALEAEHGHHEAAARLLGTVATAVERLGSIAPDVAYQIGDTEGAVREALGPEAADRAIAAGRALALDELVAELIT